MLLYPPLDYAATYGGEFDSNFRPGFYDPVSLESDLTAMRGLGYNTVRTNFDVFYHTNLTAAPGERLSAEYLDNLADFLMHARQLGMHVILVFGYVPITYYDLVEQICSGVPADPDYETVTETISGIDYQLCGHRSATGYNALYVHRGIIDAFGQFIVDALDGLNQRDPDVFDALLSIDMFEPYLAADTKPFSQTTGTVTLTLAAEKTYDMDIANPLNNRQELADDMAAFWLDQIMNRVHAAYPDVLTAAGVFTPYSTGRSGYVGVTLAENNIDPRQGMRVSIVANSPVDYVDVHVYPIPVWRTPYVLSNDMASAELDHLLVQKPLMMGETGVIQGYQPDLGLAVATMVGLYQDSCTYGFSGWLYFPWNGETVFWDASDGDGAINQALSPAGLPNPCSVPMAVHRFQDYP